MTYNLIFHGPRGFIGQILNLVKPTKLSYSHVVAAMGPFWVIKKTSVSGGIFVGCLNLGFFALEISILHLKILFVNCFFDLES